MGVIIHDHGQEVITPGRILVQINVWNVRAHGLRISRSWLGRDRSISEQATLFSFDLRQVFKTLTGFLKLKDSNRSLWNLNHMLTLPHFQLFFMLCLTSFGR
jgi:hypothetical protein